MSVDIGDGDRERAITGNTPHMNVVRIEDIPGGVRDDADGGVRMERSGNQQRRRQAEEGSGSVQAFSMPHALA